MAWSDPCVPVARDGGSPRGQPQIAYEKLVEALPARARAMKLYLAVARRRLGELAHDDASQEQRRQADQWMAEQGIVNPSRITRLIAPGFPDARE